jgi:hypothetical protein
MAFRRTKRPWIPTFAGTTAEGFAAVATRPESVETSMSESGESEPPAGARLPPCRLPCPIRTSASKRA